MYFEPFRKDRLVATITPSYVCSLSLSFFSLSLFSLSLSFLSPSLTHSLSHPLSLSLLSLSLPSLSFYVNMILFYVTKCIDAAGFVVPFACFAFAGRRRR